MSFISVNATQLARDLWPERVGRPVHDQTELKDLPSWKVVPATYEGLCQWICVDREDGQASPMVLIHPDHHDTERKEVTLRIQGIVVESNLNALGNWNGDVQHAPKAVQALTLTGGSCKDPFSAQQRALANIRELILKLLCLPPPTPQRQKGDIFLKRRVFTKVQASCKAASALTPQDDPLGRAAKIAHMWNVDHRIVVGVQREDGAIVRANPLVIRRGDLVDVAVTIEVITMRARKSRKTEIIFCPQEVVRLVPATKITALLRSLSGHAVITTVAQRAPSVASGFTFTEEEEQEGMLVS